MKGPALRTTALLLILALALGLAAWHLMAGGDAAYPDTPESATPWMCERCGQVVWLTARQRAVWGRDPKRVRHQQPRPGTIVAGSQQTVFYCDACGAFTIVRARECPRHNRLYIVRNASGQPVGCAACLEEEGG